MYNKSTVGGRNIVFVQLRITRYIKASEIKVSGAFIYKRMFCEGLFWKNILNQFMKCCLSATL